MGKKLGIVIFHFFAFISFIIGVIQLIDSTTIPARYHVYSGSAIQATEVYSAATFQALTAVGFLLVAIFIEMALFFGYPNESMLQLQKETELIRTMVTRIGSMLNKNLPH